MLNRMVAHILAYMPKKLVWVFSQRYIAGETLDDGIATSKALNAKGILVTVDLLGEFISTIGQAEANLSAYLTIIERFQQDGIEGNFSLKPTSFGLLIDQEHCYQLVRETVKLASSYQRFVRIDMEDSQCTDAEIALYVRLKEEFPQAVGLVLQAYLRRSMNDLENMARTAHSPGKPLNFRLCKGIYIEPEKLAYKGYHEVRANYLALLRYMFANGIYAAIATHDKYLIDEALKMINEFRVAPSMYEFQMLYGVTPNLRDSLVSAGHKMRLYVPFGSDWFGYCSRRMKENPKMVGDIVKALFYRG